MIVFLPLKKWMKVTSESRKLRNLLENESITFFLQNGAKPTYLGLFVLKWHWNKTKKPLDQNQWKAPYLAEK